MATKRQRALARALLDHGGQTYAKEAGITLEDKPAALYRLHVLSLLMSAPISGEIALRSAREIFKAGYTTPRKMRDATWQQRIDAMVKGGYRRYDESTSTTLGEGAEFLLERYGGDLRRMASAAGGDVTRLRSLLKEVKGIGNVGADLFLREAQGVWPMVRPYVDKQAIKGAQKLGLPEDPQDLAELVGEDDLSGSSPGWSAPPATRTWPTRSPESGGRRETSARFRRRRPRDLDPAANYATWCVTVDAQRVERPYRGGEPHRGPAGERQGARCGTFRGRRLRAVPHGLPAAPP